MQTPTWVFFALTLSGLHSPLLRAQESRHPVTGRVYAGVMGVGGAPWLERSGRENEEHTRLAVRLLDLRPGMVVADVGAGSGYYTEMLARQVGPGGRVYATDIQPGMIRLLQERVSKARLDHVEVLLGYEADPRLPADALDLILLADVYHEFSKPREMLRALRASLKPGGRLVLLEFRKEDPSVPIRPEHKMSVAEVRAELEPEGLRFERVLPGLPWQHILIFLK
ncbi:MAG: class I SAM-dependent methyltransferase [Candidatus Solibacter usitatus]|nr:class I SAM-dependent methyltransferase [Candidatus Solibacter usitatus]